MAVRYPIAKTLVVSNIAVDIVLSVVTCGIYNLFWQARQFKALNAFLGQPRFNFLNWFLLCMVTCGLYHIYTEYLIGTAIQEIQANAGRKVTGELPVLCLLLSVFGLSIVADAIQQNEINSFFAR